MVDITFTSDWRLLQALTTLKLLLTSIVAISVVPLKEDATDFHLAITASSGILPVSTPGKTKGRTDILLTISRSSKTTFSSANWRFSLL